jgi:hypothetical protein
MNLARLGPLGAGTPLVVTYLDERCLARRSVEQGRRLAIGGRGRTRHELVGGPQ